MSIAVKEKASKWLELFNLVSKTSTANPMLTEIREKAIQAFTNIGLPDRKTEDYKYTNIRLYLNDGFACTTKNSDLSKGIIEPLFIKDYATFVVVNGQYVKDLSQINNLPEEITLTNLFDAITEGNTTAIKYFNKQVAKSKNPLGMLNTALANGGLFINVPTKYNCKVPIHILNISTSDQDLLANPRHLIHLGKEAALTLVESYCSVDNTGKAFTNSATEIIMEENAAMTMYMLQSESGNASQHNIHHVAVDKGGKLNSTVVTLNGNMVRNDLNVLLHGENAEIHLNGLFTLQGKTHADNHTLVEHFAPNCFSNELYKGIIADNATGVFNGKIYVHPEAQKTNAYQSNKNVLLGNASSINTKPQLEIYADDVKCTHGTSTGRLNEEALFYLQSRGLNKDLARKLLLKAFANEVTDTIKDGEVKAYLEQRMPDL